MTYYVNKDLTSVTDAKNSTYNYKYDEKHNLVQSVTQNKVATDHKYDTYGNNVQTIVRNNSSSLQIKTETTYTDNGAYISKTYDQDGNETSYDYDQAKGLLNSITTPMLDEKKSTINYSYDPNNDQLTGVSGTMGGNTVSNSYEYSKDLLAKITHNGFSYNFAYDIYGNNTTVSVGDQPLASYDYGANNGNLTTVTYGNGNKTSYQYDEYGNIIQTSVDGSPRYQWKSDSQGNIIQHEDLQQRLLYNYEYDLDGKLIRQNVADTTKSATAQRTVYSLEYGYDANNNVNRFVNQVGKRSLTHSYTYGLDDLLITYTMPSEKTVTYNYDTLSRLKGYQIPTVNPITVTYNYAISNRNIGTENIYRTTKISSESMGNKVLQYSYDKVGNIIEIKEKDVNGDYISKYSYEYDELNQLIRENDVDQNVTKTYTYDIGGNILKVEEYKTNSEGQLELFNSNTYDYTDSNWKDKLTAYNGQPITYDAIGNPLSYNGYTLGWSNGRELTTLSGNGVEASYTYDADGLRATKIVNGIKTTYEYLGGQLLYEKKGSTEIHYLYDSNGSIKGIQTVDGSGIVSNYYVVTNIRGDVEQIYDNSGNLQVSYTYDAWGKILSIKDGNGNEITSESNIGKLNSLKYRSYYYDDETGLYYLQSRYYNPVSGRFINADDTGILKANGELESNNLYAYCRNSPINNIDTNGYFAVPIALAVGAFVVSVIVYFVFIQTPSGKKIIKRIEKDLRTLFSKIKNDVDPFARPNQKKQNRERKEKKKKNDGWVSNPNKKPAPPKKHTPGKEHRKY